MTHAGINDDYSDSGSVYPGHEADGFSAEVGLGWTQRGINPKREDVQFCVVGGKFVLGLELGQSSTMPVWAKNSTT
jgi:hypothetical protein